MNKFHSESGATIDLDESVAARQSIESDLPDPVVLGHSFRPMDDSDYVGLSGAEPDSHICELEDRILVLNPNGSVTEILADGSEYVWSVTQR